VTTKAPPPPAHKSGHSRKAAIRDASQYQSIAKLKREWPKGCAPPPGYLAWSDWAEAQTAHGLEQTLCDWCKRYYFPVESADHVFCRAAASAKRNGR
jgi:hypothetical protein